MVSQYFTVYTRESNLDWWRLCIRVIGEAQSSLNMMSWLSLKRLNVIPTVFMIDIDQSHHRDDNMAKAIHNEFVIICSSK